MLEYRKLIEWDDRKLVIPTEASIVLEGTEGCYCFTPANLNFYFSERCIYLHVSSRHRQLRPVDNNTLQQLRRQLPGGSRRMSNCWFVWTARRNGDRPPLTLTAIEPSVRPGQEGDRAERVGAGIV